MRNLHLGYLLIKSPAISVEFALLPDYIHVILGRRVQDILILDVLFLYTSF